MTERDTEVENGKITTIKLEEKTKNRLSKLKVHKRETFDEVLKHVLEILNICKISPERAQARLRGIDRQMKRSTRKGN